MSNTAVPPAPLEGGNEQHDAFARIASQDTGQIWTLLTRQAISPTLYEIMVSQLGNACNAPGSAFMPLTQKGVELMRAYPFLGFTQQLSWIRADLRLREEIYIRDGRQMQSQYGQNSTGLDAHSDAIVQRMRINGENIQHLKKVEGDLVALIPQQPQLKPQPQHESVSALQARSRSNPPVATERQVLSKMLSSRALADPELKFLLSVISSESGTPEQLKVFEKHVGEIKASIAATKAPAQPPRTQRAEAVANPLNSKLHVHRARLQPLPTNAPVKSDSQQLKRKREHPHPNADTQIVPPVDDGSEDEGELQGKLAVLQAKIAAIQARTANEDERLPKKTKTNLKNATVPSITREAPPNVARLQEPAAADNCVLEDPFHPPRSSQDVRFKPSRQSGPASAADFSSSRNFKVSQDDAGLLRDGQARPLSIQEAPFFPVKREAEPFPARRPASAMRAPIVRPVDVVDLTSSSPPPQEQSVIPAVTSSEPVLCAEQQEVVDLIVAGHNVFYTGSAGCGKSTVLKSFVPKLRDLGKLVKIVAPTGKAALDINGSTTWTYAGWTPSHFKKPLEDLIKAAHGKFVRQRFNDTDVLVIDEISMVENHMLQRLDAVMKEARGNATAFGGVQLVVTGDFCQLPPVKPFQFCINCGRGQTQRISGGKTVYRCPIHGDCRDDDKWAFRSKAWDDCKFKHINLSKIHRQKDEVFIKILQKLRVGTVLSNDDRRLLLDHRCDVTNAVKLFPRRMEVKRINDTEFDRLTSQKHGYTCLDLFSWNEVHGNLQSKGIRNRFDDSLDALREHRLENLVEYKIGMLVVLLVNLDIASGLVNGSQGRIVGFEEYNPSKLPKATVFEGGGGGSSGRNAASQRKSGAGRSGSGRFRSSQRRGRDGSSEPESIVMGELRGEHAILREGQIRQFLERPCNTSKLWPIVEFDNGIKRTIFADCQVNELGDEKPYTLLVRTQIPLIAAWAMTIHKSQGMTLNKVIVDLGNSFEEGQEYVALSRARSLEGLKVISLGAGVGKGGNEQVKEFLWQRFKIR